MSTESNVSPAAELRAAASKIRETARNATPGPWTVGERGDVDEIDHYERPILAEVDSREEDGTPFKEIVQVAAVSYHTNGFQYPHAEAQAEAEHIALWNPVVAELVADWLDAVAVMWDGLINDADRWGFLKAEGRDALRSGPWDAQHALNLARAINGGAR